MTEPRPPRFYRQPAFWIALTMALAVASMLAQRM